MNSMKKIIPTTAINIFCFITLLLLPTHCAIEAKIDDSKDKYVAAKSGINLRSGPGKSSSVITLIPFESKVTIEKSDGDEIFLDGRYGKWVNVKFGNKTGWVFSGFLCDFKPDTIIKPVVDFYKDKYREDDWILDYMDAQVYIVNIIDNYILLAVPLTISEASTFAGRVVWKYDVKQKKFFEMMNFEDCNSAELFYLDNDRFPDLIVNVFLGSIPYRSYRNQLGCDIFLGSEQGFKKIDDAAKNFCNYYMHYYLTEGSCEDMRFVCSKRDTTGNTDYRTMYFFKFNCNKRNLEKYAESKITRSSGVITSIDFKKMSVAIREDSKSTLYKFSNKRFASDEDIKYLKMFKKDDEVIFYYETIDGKKMILDIRWDFA